MSKGTNIISIINFARAIEPRLEVGFDLFQTTEKELAVLRENNLKSTLLLQYDALITPHYQRLVKRYPEVDVGLWLEIVAPLAEKAGLQYKGRWDWDYYANVGFTVGYTKDERIKLADVAFEEFKNIFGKYPSCIGSWFIDVFTLNYIYEKYNVKACSMCVDQLTIDGYNIWGGMANTGFYPSKNNLLCPALSKETQLNLPVFRMLGGDPLHNYDHGIYTLEPAADYNKQDDFFKYYFNSTYNDTLSLSFTSIGQENSFGWPRFGSGFVAQIDYIAKNKDKLGFKIMTLTESGEWFKENYKTTPASHRKSLTDWQGTGHKSMWYQSVGYKTNIYSQDGALLLRDFILFDDRVKEKYFDNIEHSNESYFNNLPVVYGKYKKGGLPDGLYFCNSDGSLYNSEIISSQILNDNAVKITCANGFEIICSEQKMKVFSSNDYILKFNLSSGFNTIKIADQKKIEIKFEFGGKTYRYAMTLAEGYFNSERDFINIVPINGTIEFTLNGRYTI